MWTTLKKFFTSKPAPSPPVVDLVAITMFQQIVKSHLKGRSLYFKESLPTQSQSQRIVDQAKRLGIPGNDVITVDKNIKTILADNALGRVKT